jgi:hypothetical protein
MAASVPWRRALRRHLTALLVVKLVALSALWVLFFSPVHRGVVGSHAVERRLAVLQPQPARPVAAARTAAQEGAHD